MLYFRVYDHSGEHFSFQSVNEDNFTIGSGGDADVHVSDKRVSREHCRVEKREDKFFLIDNNSTNGVFDHSLNKVQELELTEGVEIHLGHTKIVFSFNAFQKEKTQEIIIKPSQYKWAVGKINYSFPAVIIIVSAYFILSLFDVWMNYIGKKDEIFKVFSLEILGQVIFVFIVWMLLVVVARVFSGELRTRSILFEFCAFLIFIFLSQYFYFAFAWVTFLTPIFMLLNVLKFFFGFVLVFRAMFYHNNFLRCAKWAIACWAASFFIQLAVEKAYDPHVSTPVLESRYSATGWNWGSSTNTTQELVEKAQGLYKEVLKGAP